MRHALVVVLAIAGVAGAPAAEPQYSSELLFPLESWHNHSSSIVELPNRDLLVCWFHGSGERTADDVLIRGARWRSARRGWSAPFTMADAPGFPETNPVLFIDRRERLFFFWPLIIAHRWETALMKYRISTDYQQAEGPPAWAFQDNIVIAPKDIIPKTKAFVSEATAGTAMATIRSRSPVSRALPRISLHGASRRSRSPTVPRSRQMDHTMNWTKACGHMLIPPRR